MTRLHIRKAKPRIAGFAPGRKRERGTSYSEQEGATYEHVGKQNCLHQNERKVRAKVLLAQESADSDECSFYCLPILSRQQVRKLKSTPFASAQIGRCHISKAAPLTLKPFFGAGTSHCHAHPISINQHLEKATGA